MCVCKGEEKKRRFSQLSVSDLTHPLLNLNILFTLHTHRFHRLSHIYIGHKVWHIERSVKLIQRQERRRYPWKQGRHFDRLFFFIYIYLETKGSRYDNIRWVNKSIKLIISILQCLIMQSAWLLLRRVILMWSEEEVGFILSKQNFRATSHYPKKNNFRWNNLCFQDQCCCCTGTACAGWLAGSDNTAVIQPQWHLANEEINLKCRSGLKVRSCLWCFGRLYRDGEKTQLICSKMWTSRGRKRNRSLIKRLQ